MTNQKKNEQFGSGSGFNSGFNRPFNPSLGTFGVPPYNVGSPFYDEIVPEEKREVYLLCGGEVFQLSNEIKLIEKQDDYLCLYDSTEKLNTINTNALGNLASQALPEHVIAVYKLAKECCKDRSIVIVDFARFVKTVNDIFGYGKNGKVIENLNCFFNTLTLDNTLYFKYDDASNIKKSFRANVLITDVVSKIGECFGYKYNNKTFARFVEVVQSEEFDEIESEEEFKELVGKVNQSAAEREAEANNIGYASVYSMMNLGYPSSFLTVAAPIFAEIGRINFAKIPKYGYHCKMLSKISFDKRFEQNGGMSPLTMAQLLGCGPKLYDNDEVTTDN